MTLSDLETQVRGTQVRIFAANAAGSGTVIASILNEKKNYSSYILTCHHVIEGLVKVDKEWDSALGRDRKMEHRQNARIEFFDYTNVEFGKPPVTSGVTAQIIAYDKLHDLAVLKAGVTHQYDSVANMPTRSAVERIKVGTPIYACGCGLALDPVLTQGFLNHVGFEMDYKDYWGSSAVITFGNCISEDSRILTDNGVYSIADIPAGASVYGSVGNYLSKANVLDVINSGRQKLFTLETATRSIEATEEHPFLTSKGWTPLKNLRKGDLVRVFTGIPSSNSTVSREEAFLIGLFLGDGYLRIREDNRKERALSDGSHYKLNKLFESGEITFCLFGESQHHLPVLESVIGCKGHVDSRGIHFYSLKYAKRLRDLGVDYPARMKHIPNWVFNESTENKKAVLEGLLESDGWLDAIQAWRFELSSRELVRGIQDLAASIGWRVSKTYERTRHVNITNQIGKTYPTTSTMWETVVYPPKFKSRKYFDGLYDKVTSVTEEGMGDVYDLKLDSVHNFVANNMIVHNSGGGAFYPSGDKYYFVGVPSRVTVQGWGDVCNHIGFFSPVTRVYDFLNEQLLHFLVPGSTHTEAQCFKEIDERKEAEELRLKSLLPSDGKSSKGED